MSNTQQVVPDDADHTWQPNDYQMPDYDETEPLDARPATHTSNTNTEDVHSGGAA